VKELVFTTIDRMVAKGEEWALQSILCSELNEMMEAELQTNLARQQQNNGRLCTMDDELVVIHAPAFVELWEKVVQKPGGYGDLLKKHDVSAPRGGFIHAAVVADSMRMAGFRMVYVSSRYDVNNPERVATWMCGPRASQVKFLFEVIQGSFDVAAARCLYESETLNGTVDSKAYS